MISVTAVLAALAALAAGVAAMVVPAVGAAFALAITNLIAFAIVLPIKWGVEAVHRLIHRDDK